MLVFRRRTLSLLDSATANVSDARHLRLSSLCSICFERPPDATIYKCGHCYVRSLQERTNQSRFVSSATNVLMTGDSAGHRPKQEVTNKAPGHYARPVANRSRTLFASTESNGSEFTVIFVVHVLLSPASLKNVKLNHGLS